MRAALATFVVGAASQTAALLASRPPPLFATSLLCVRPDGLCARLDGTQPDGPRTGEERPPNPSGLPQLPAVSEVRPSVARTVEVGGEALQLDELGPIVIQEDGRLGRLANWHEMTEGERRQTMAFVAKRNAKRRKALLARQAEQGGGDGAV